MADLLQTNAGPARLRELLAAAAPVLAPGVYDALTARLVEHVGFAAVYMTGFATTASLLGRPDIGLLSMMEMVDNARRIVRAVEIPVIADADDGHGNAINVIRTVQEFEAAGVSAVHLEDQVAPKRCGHMDGKEIISRNRMVEKIRAAVEARRSDDFVVIARTDAIATDGLDEAIARAHAYGEAGADVLFVEAPETVEDVERIARELGDAPLLYNWLEGARSPALGRDELAALGFDLVIFPLTGLFTATRAVRDVLRRLHDDGSPVNVADDLVEFEDFTDFIGMDDVRGLERRFTTTD